MKIKVADYLVSKLVELTGSEHCFLLSGGGMLHLLDAIVRNDQVIPISMHHEQAAVIAADAYGRVNNTIGVAFVTSGPGGTNAITGVAGAWLESTPLLVISGQVSRATWKWDSKVRQMGFQEIDIIPIVKSITKYATMILDPTEIRYHLEKAIFLAKTGRPGPVWLDIPLDVQAAEIEDSNLISFDPNEIGSFVELKSDTNAKIHTVLEWLKESKRPLLLGGHGVWLSDSKELFNQLINTLQIPVQTSWNGIDLIEDSHPLYFGRHNSYGPRYPNFIVQNCDLLISIGSRLCLQQIGFNYHSYAREAKKIIIDIDPAELVKPTIKPDLAIQADAKYFIEQLLKEIKNTSFKVQNINPWIEWCKVRKAKYPICSNDYLQDDEYIDPYVFVNTLSQVLPENSLIIPGSSGTGFTVSNQVFKIKKGQRFFTNKGLAAMGYGLPSSIGGCFAAGKKETVTIIGDGGFQLNIQELQTIVHHLLPIKIFYFNNQGYLSIRVSQQTYCQGRLIGSHPGSGVSFPNLQKLSETYGISYAKIERTENLNQQIDQVLQIKGPVLCEVMLNPNKIPLPKLASYKKADGSMESRPLEDLYPLLPREEFHSNMIINDWLEKEDL
jgi:acetolactate synthase-1/2/3 large subunit